jgi:hypothetical protein
MALVGPVTKFTLVARGRCDLMSLISGFISQPPMALTRELLVILLIVVLGTLATLTFNGPGAGVPYDTRLDQVPLPF